MTRTALGAVIRQRRQKRGLSLAHAAELTGISPQKWSDIERGARSCGEKVLARIARALNTTPAVMRLRAEVESQKHAADEEQFNSITKLFLAAADQLELARERFATN